MQIRQQQNSKMLWSSSFIALNMILLLNFCNIAIFFQFNSHLKGVGMDPSRIGLVIGLFSLAALVVRPFISLFMQPVNSRRWIFGGVVGTVACLLSYNMAHSFTALAILRLVHGSVYVVMVSAAMAALTGCIPPAKSGQAFGVVGVVALLPFALIPPLLPILEHCLGGYLAVLTATALPVSGILLLLPLIRPDRDDGAGHYRFNWKELAANLKQTVILTLLIVSLLMYTAFSSLFYYIQDFAVGMSIPLPGLFFTLATVSEIATRLGLAPFLDRVGKKQSIAISLGILTASYLALPFGGYVWLFLGLAVIFGIAWGVSVPAVSALIFDLSEPRFRAMNTNMGFEMMQGGYFIGPYIGGAVIERSGYGVLFAACAGFCLLGLCLVAAAGITEKQMQPSG